MFNKVLRAFSTLFLATSILPSPASADQFHTISVGVPPWVTGKINRLWALHINRSGEKHKIRVRLSSTSDYKTFIKRGMNHDFDLMLTPAYIAAYLWKYHKYQILSLGKYQTDVTFITLNDSSIHQFSDINGRSIGMPDPIAQVSLKAQQHLKSQNLIYRTHYYGQHDTVLSKVLNGVVEVGVVAERVLIDFKAVVNGRLKVIHKISAPGGGIVIASPKLPEEAKQKVLSTLFDLNEVKTNFLPLWAPATANSGKELLEIDEYAVSYIKEYMESKQR